MTWLMAATAALVAACMMALAVPRVRVDDPEAPSFEALATPGGAVAAGLTALGCALLVTTPLHGWTLWWPYLALGAPLIYVDLRTTWLPRRLNAVAAGAMALGGVALVALDWRLAVAAALGSLAAGAFFHLAWRFTGGLGFGDVRLGFLVGAVAGLGGPTAWVTGLLIGTVLGALHGVGHALWARRSAERPQHFPYGPALWLGPVIASAIAG